MNRSHFHMMTFTNIDKLYLRSNLGICLSDFLPKDILPVDDWTPWVSCKASVIASKNEVVYDIRVVCLEFEIRLLEFSPSRIGQEITFA